MDNKTIPDYSIVLFASRDCPLCMAYGPFVRNLADSTVAWSNWKLFIVYPDADTSDLPKDKHVTELSDSKNVLRDYFQATITPEVFVVDSGSKVLYKGAIDNYAYETGKHRTVATEHYLLNAIYAIRTGQKIEIEKTKAVGCYIE